MGRGLGYSGAVRVAGAMLAHVERNGVAAAADHDTRVEVLRLTAELEGHPDNVAASVFGGMVIADGDLVSPASVDLGLSVVVWVPAADSTSTDRSRATLPTVVNRPDAVFNMARVATLITAVAAGDLGLLRRSVADRLHQDIRFAAAPASAQAATAMESIPGVHGVWLSGSGPTVAGWVKADELDQVVAGVRDATGASADQVLGLAVDREGVRVDP
jgi:homoserine kinase